MQLLTKNECRIILKKLALECGIDPNLISTRLLSLEDKKEMMQGHLPLETLRTAISTWKASNMPDYANGFTNAFKSTF